ncbi:MAG TPA: helicase-related protein, partial [Sphingobacteriaceae bacterium]
MILLTGTLSPKYEKNLRDFFLVNPFLIRKSSTRLNLKLRVKSLQGPHAVHLAIIDRIEAFKNEAKTEERCIIYVLTIAEVQLLRERLKEAIPSIAVGTYYAQLEVSRKLAAVMDWKTGGTPIMIATTAFGMGVDYPAVRLVIVCGGSCTFLDVVQQFGRAGRDGVVSECALFTSISHLETIQAMTYKQGTSEQEKIDMEEFQQMKQFAENRTICSRFIIAEYVDGTGMGIPCMSLPNAEFCNTAIRNRYYLKTKTSYSQSKIFHLYW